MLVEGDLGSVSTAGMRARWLGTNKGGRVFLQPPPSLLLVSHRSCSCFGQDVLCPGGLGLPLYTLEQQKKTNKAEVHVSTAVEKYCIKAGNIQCALQMKRFFICVVKEEKYRQAQLITQESSCGYQRSSALIPSDNSKLNQHLS